MWPSASFDSVGTPNSLISRLNTGPARTLSTLRLRPCGRQRMTRGHRGSLPPRRRAFSSPSPCRFIPALQTHSIGGWWANAERSDGAEDAVRIGVREEAIGIEPAPHGLPLLPLRV